MGLQIVNILSRCLLWTELCPPQTHVEALTPSRSEGIEMGLSYNDARIGSNPIELVSL